MKRLTDMVVRASDAAAERMLCACVACGVRIRALREEGQGTVEYAILVGVLAVIAILAIVSFKDKIQDLWDAISSGLGDL